MFKIFIFIWTFPFFLFGASQIEVVSDKFEADEGRGVTKFLGNVTVKKEADRIESNELFIYFDKNRNPTKYEAIGNSKFNITVKDKKYDGKAHNIIYEPILKKYSFLGEAYLHEVEGDKKIYGEKIFIDELSGKYEVFSDEKRPVKLIFKIEEK